ncbi:uncharacterized protein F4822DRAFT_1682 [Hypoxylon trugodes]|uniref:uncharacterized protein n=1 Tax=Hypoxylon trugodes TaxID=326681 RepID=UPI00219FFB04|nr:uncharacterized protein F4822DRAFT_1682 [Hypoxylon trugodes]KAI1393150.1 hypothetical protein F4822DRAFT_1682 [Hypoxylon trugodes]
MDLNSLNHNLNGLVASALDVFRRNRTVITATAAVVAAGSTISIFSRIISDYRAWHALGPNGVPLNPFGYVAQSIAGLVARRDVRDPKPYDDAKLSETMYGPITRRSFFPGGRSLPRRRDPRPDIAPYAAPHRQSSQKGTSAMRARQESFFYALVSANPSLFQIKPSNLEGPLFKGLWLQDGLPVRRELRGTNGEFAHVHGEGSTHLVFSLADSAAAIENGWAERHPMSGVGRIMTWGYVMVYAPRDEEDFKVWRQFIITSAKYALGGEAEVVMP